MKNACAAILERWNLLNHPFYQAWSQGTLPVGALQKYAGEYGAFIRTLPQGWATLGDNDSAQIEVEHAALWDTFAAALGTEVSAPKEAGTHALLTTANELFASEATAVGALYAFEAQQPATAHSKLLGLDTHYDLPAGVRPYFEAHAMETGEVEMLDAKFAALSPEGQRAAVAGCETLAKGMWDALTSLHADC